MKRICRKDYAPLQANFKSIIAKMPFIYKYYYWLQCFSKNKPDSSDGMY